MEEVGCARKVTCSSPFTEARLECRPSEPIKPRVTEPGVLLIRHGTHYACHCAGCLFGLLPHTIHARGRPRELRTARDALRSCPGNGADPFVRRRRRSRGSRGSDDPLVKAGARAATVSVLRRSV